MAARVVYLLCTLVACAECIPELKLLHVVFAHKFYAPLLDSSDDDVIKFPKNLTYAYFNSATHDMPNVGKLNMYNLGVYLRKTYGDFLGDVYTEGVMKMRTTEYALSMLSGQLVNAGLWPPVGDQRWDQDMDWQPIPSEYAPMDEDTLLMGMHCPSFVSEMQKVLKMEQRNMMLHYATLFDYISHHTGIKVRRPSDVALLYASLETRADLNLSLPHWAREIFPHGQMYNIVLFEYDLLTQTPLQKQLNGGTILKEIIGNSLKHIQGIIPRERKMMMYSGNERNIVAVLKNLKLWSPHIPSEASSLIFELYYDNDTQVHGIKVNYYTGVDGDTIPLQIANCTEICPLKTFVNLFFEALPKNEEILCNWRIPDFFGKEIFLDTQADSFSPSYKPKDIIICSLLIFVLTINRLI